MAFLSGPRRGVPRIKLHDPPPGYRPPKKSSWHLTVNENHARVIVAVTTVILALVAIAFAAIMVLMIAGYR